MRRVFEPPSPRRRAREFGLEFGPHPVGRHNAITDVPGVRVGQVTIWRDPGRGDHGVGRTGVTAIVPDGIGDLFHRPMAAGVAVLNGAGELTGSIEIREWGILETPVVLVSTNNVGRAADALVDAALAAGVGEVVLPVVGECDDSWLDDITRRWVATDDVRTALDSAVGGPVDEGVVGAGTGMVTMGHKSGIGTSSRVIEGVGTVGVLVLCNFGGAEQLRIQGRLVGPRLAAGLDTTPTLDRGGSCLGLVMTDIPLDARQCERLARRVGLGLARVGSVAHHGSGDIFLAVSTTNRIEREALGLVDVTVLADRSLGSVFEAVVDAAEEAVTNALFVADTVVGVDGHSAPGLDVDAVLDLIG
ncbi:MAG: aminopeptidase [Acidimicrobiaceae bacterium]|nr:aminopeptidase [Acidimicrobiaceae bacterium]